MLNDSGIGNWVDASAGEGDDLINWFYSRVAVLVRRWMECGGGGYHENQRVDLHSGIGWLVGRSVGAL